MADLSIELGDDSGAALDVDTEKIGEKFIEFHWRQTIPFLGSETLRQNKGQPRERLDLHTVPYRFSRLVIPQRVSLTHGMHRFAAGFRIVEPQFVEFLMAQRILGIVGLGEDFLHAKNHPPGTPESALQQFWILEDALPAFRAHPSYVISWLLAHCAILTDFARRKQEALAPIAISKLSGQLRGRWAAANTALLLRILSGTLIKRGPANGIPA
jgi:hypothetical protein